MRSCNNYLVVVAMIFGVTLTSCDENDVNPREFTVSFNSNEGSAVSSQTVKDGEKSKKPEDPTRNEYTFVAWYKEVELSNKWEFDIDIVTADITLYAKWIAEDCEKDDNLEVEDSGKTTISLMERDDYSIFDKIVILYETEKYLIKTPLFHFLGGMNNLFGLDYDKFLSILKKIVSDGRTNNLLYTSSYFDTNQTDYVLANFLENGFCHFYDKKKESIVKQVVFEYRREPVSFAGERKFYIDNVLFLETVDAYIGYKGVNPFIGIMGPKEDGMQINVPLIKRDDYVVFEKTVIVYEDESYLIKTPLSYFLSENYNFFYLSIDGHLSALETIISDGQTNDLLNSSPYFTNQSRIKFVLAGFLESGHCHIYDKKNKTNITHILVEYWGYSPAPLSGAGGRRFYIDNVLFLETTDWIS
jgi:uncharacterized repeat protein (TIGR02543 family)